MYKFFINFSFVFVALLIVNASETNAQENPDKILLDWGSTWKYYDQATDPGETWNTANFNDIQWEEGPAQLGYGDGDEATTISYGDDGDIKPLAAYFRANFTIDNLDELYGVRINLLFDDGAVVYVNGQEAFRVRMPMRDSYIGFNTLAEQGAGDNASAEGAIKAEYLVEGENTIAVEVHQDSPSSSDLSFDCRVREYRLPSPKVSFFEMGSTWKYLDDGTDQGTEWVNPDFDDSNWEEGAGQLGYGDNDEATKLSYGPNSSDKYPTYYFRKTFTAEEARQIEKGLVGKVLHDDGVAIYVNGTLVFTANMPDDWDYNTFAASQPSDNTIDDFEVIPALLNLGENTIAVEVKQVSPSSSDMSFDMELMPSETLITDEPAAVVVVPVDHIWSYFDEDMMPAEDWYAIDFDDSAWGSGPGPIGYDHDENTTISYGNDGSDKHETAYIRTEFEIENLNDYLGGLMMDYRYDDGGIVYLNGEELFRVNVYPGEWEHNDLTQRGTHRRKSFLIPAEKLIEGTNVFAVAMKQSSRGSSDLIFELEVTKNDAPEYDVLIPWSSNWKYLDNGAVLPSDWVELDYPTVRQGDDVFAFDFGSVWKYLDDGSDQGTAWRAVDFDDSVWESGPGQLGYGDGDEATVLSYGDDAGNKYPTTYFRKTFDFDKSQFDRAVNFTLMYDDAAVVYLNGEELYRAGSLPDVVKYDDYATAAGSDNAVTTMKVPLDKINDGENTIAVEIHQRSGNSSDISFDFKVVQLGGNDWSEGIAEIGYGDGDELTVASYGGDSRNKHIQYYFRNIINIDDLSKFEDGFAYDILFDDYAWLWVNGEYIGFFNRGGDNTVKSGVLPTALFNEGENIIAVRVNQSSGTSSDMSFNFELREHIQLPEPPLGPTEMLTEPFMQNPAMDAMTITWETNNYVIGYVEYKEAGTEEVLRTTGTKLSKFPKIRLTGLKPFTKYDYRVNWFDVETNEKTLTDWYSFYTSPEEGDSYTLGIYGDNRNNPSVHHDCTQRILARDPHLVLNSGDLVGNGRRYNEWEDQYFTPAAEMLKYAPLLPAWGNHEYSGGANGFDFHQYFEVPDNGTSNDNQKYYAMTYGDVRFIVLNSEEVSSYANRIKIGEGGEQWDWLMEELNSKEFKDSRWQIAMWHRPGWTSGGHTGNETPVRTWDEVMENHGIDIIVNGHNHHYERSYRNGVQYITSGGGGAGKYSFDRRGDNPYSVQREYTWNYFMLDVTPNSLTMKAYDLEEDDEKFDEFVMTNLIQKGPYLQKPTTTSMTVMWETTEPCPTVLEWMPKGADETTLYKDEQAKTVHKVELTGLNPDSEYVYRVSINGVERTNPQPDPNVDYVVEADTKVRYDMDHWYEFNTAPEGVRDVRVAFYGDTRTYPERHQKVIEGVVSKNPEVIVQTGDLVGSGLNYDDWQREFFNPTEGAFTQIPLIPVWGNHEYSGSEGYDFYQLFDVYENGTQNDERKYYAFTYAGVRFVNLNSEQQKEAADVGMLEGSEQWEWLMNEIQSDEWNNATWRIVSWHRPNYTSGGHLGLEEPAGRIWLSELEAAGADFIMWGHNHHYERSVRNGLQLMTVGGGGAPAYAFDRDGIGSADENSDDFDYGVYFGVGAFNKYSVVRELRLSYTIFDISENSLEVSAYDAETGEKFDNFIVKRLEEPTTEFDELSICPMFEVEYQAPAGVYENVEWTYHLKDEVNCCYNDIEEDIMKALYTEVEFPNPVYDFHQSETGMNIFTEEGEYTVSFSGTTPDGKKVYASQIINVENNCDIVVDIPDEIEMCASTNREIGLVDAIEINGETYQMTVRGGTGDYENYEIQWIPDNNLVNADTWNPTIVEPKNSRLIYLNVIDPNTGRSGNDQLNLIVKDPVDVELPLFVRVDKNESFALNQAVESPSTGDPTYTFRWVDDQGVEVSGSENLEIASGLYKYFVTVTDDEGCKSEERRLIVFKSYRKEAEKGELAIGENGNAILFTYPNPVENELNVVGDMNQTVNANIQIVDLTGRELLNININSINSLEETIDVSSLESGAYILNVQTDNDRVSVKFVKE